MFLSVSNAELVLIIMIHIMNYVSFFPFSFFPFRSKYYVSGVMPAELKEADFISPFFLQKVSSSFQIVYDSDTKNSYY